MKRREFINFSISSAALAMMQAHSYADSQKSIPNAKVKEHLIESLELLTAAPISFMQSFYEKLIGFKVILHNENRLSIQAGKTIITFIKINDGNVRPFYHFAFNIPENKIESAFEWQRKRTPIIHPNPTGVRDSIVNFNHWNAHSIFFLDPAGNLLEYIARHDLKNSSSGDFSVNDIHYVSEIGLIVDDVQKSGLELQQQMSLNEYRPMSPGFWPIGDEHGLLLVITKGREWSSLPNQINRTDIFKTTVKIRGIDKIWQLLPYPYVVTSTR